MRAPAPPAAGAQPFTFEGCYLDSYNLLWYVDHMKQKPLKNPVNAARAANLGELLKRHKPKTHKDPRGRAESKDPRGRAESKYPHRVTE